MKIQMTLLSDAIPGNGESIPGGEDIAVLCDENGFPYYKGGTFKGIFREELTNYLIWKGDENAEDEIGCLLGRPGDTSDGAGKLRFGDLTLSETVRRTMLEQKIEGRSLHPKEILDALSYRRVFTALDEGGIAEEGSLRSARCLKEGLLFYGEIQCSREDEELVEDVLALIKWIGTMRNRGFGWVRVEKLKLNKKPDENLDEKA